MTDTRWDRALLFARTTQSLAPAQVGHRIRLRAQRGVLRAVPGARAERRAAGGRLYAAGWPAAFVSTGRRVPAGAPDAKANAAFEFEFLGQHRDLGEPPDWRPAEAAQLWRYHLHYLEWAWAFAQHGDQVWARTAFADLWRSWRAAERFGRWDEWSPYVASLRAWVLCDVFADLVAGTDVEADVVAGLTAHLGFLRRHREQDVGGNHLVKNLKALIGLGIFLGRLDVTREALLALDRELDRQVLADGGHFELSPSYHCQVLADLVDVAGLAAAVGVAVPARWPELMERMRQWLGALILPDGSLPRLNDSGPVPPELLTLLDPPPSATGLTFLAASGYARLDGGPSLAAVFDVAEACPRTLPAHAHADCLSLEVVVGGRPLLVNSGTSTYAPGARRRHERSTRAHNTVELDGTDQTEVWGTFRAARRARPTVHEVRSGSELRVTASHDGYGRLPGSPIHERSVHLTAEALVVEDRVTGGGRHDAVVTWRCAPGEVPTALRGGGVAIGGLELRVEASGDPAIAVVGPGTTMGAHVADGFGRLQPAAVLEIRMSGPLPLTCRTTIATAGASA